MMTYEEQEKIERLVAKDENAQKLITALRDDYHMALSQISHEIRNPLTYIDSSVQWIQKMHPEVEHFEFWDQIKNDLQYMRVLLDDISAFNNGDKLNICKIDPVEFACDLKDTLLPELLAHHIPLLLKLDNTYPDFYADPVRLKQVFINLLTNAIDSIEERGRITLKIFTHNKRMLLAVRDNGCGIPPEDQESIFQPFVTHKEHGTGLGLAIARKLTELQEGTLFFESIQGKGTKFILHISFEISAEEQEKKSHMYQNCSVEGIQVLLVEDNELNMEIAEFLLKEEKMIVTKAWNGREAVEIFENSEPGYFDVILMDLMMPQMGGLEATRRIRKMDREDAESIPIFAMTANAFLDDIAQSKAAGMNEHFSKPLQMEKVIDTIRFYCTAR